MQGAEQQDVFEAWTDGNLPVWICGEMGPALNVKMKNFCMGCTRRALQTMCLQNVKTCCCVSSARCVDYDLSQCRGRAACTPPGRARMYNMIRHYQARPLCNE